jgi:hypothetical protein
LGPALFALAFHPVLRKVRGDHPGVRVLAGHDDVYILGSPTDCLAAYATFITHAAGVGLSVDVGESRVYSLGMDTLVDASAALTAVATVVPAAEGLVVFGTPIGDPAWEQRHLRALLSEHRASLRALAALKNPQVSQHLLAQSQATRVTHLLRTMTPEATAELAVTHDEQLWTAFGHVTGHLSDAATQELLAPIAADGAWPERLGHWLQGALGEVAHAARLGPDATVADWARSQAQFRRADGGFSLGCASATRQAAFVGSWALAVQEGIHADFPEVGEALQAPAALRTPYVRALAEAWAEVARVVPPGATEGCPAGGVGHADHAGLDCLLALASQPRAPQDQGGRRVGRFADHLQRRLMRGITQERLLERDNHASQAWQQAATLQERDDAQDRWGRLFATSATYAHGALTTLPDEPGEYGHRNMGPRAMNGWSSFRLGIPLPDIGPGPVLTACRLHGCDRPLGNGRGHHFVHCGRLTPHGMHTALENAFAYVAQNVPGLIVKVEVATFQGSSSRMDLVICNPLTGGLQTLYVDVTMGTAMGSREYAGMPRDGARSEPGWRSARMGSAARRAEAYKQIKYVWRVQQAGGGAIFEGACVEDYGGFGEGARQVLRFIAEAAFGEPPSAVKDLFMWRGAQHIAVYAANAVVAAHDSNYLHMKGLLRLARLAQNAAEHPVENDELLLWAGEAVAGPTGPAARRLAPPRLGSPPASPLRRRRYAPVPGGAPSADSRPIHMSLGAFNDGQHMGSSLPGLGGLQQAGPLMASA